MTGKPAARLTDETAEGGPITSGNDDVLQVFTPPPTRPPPNSPF